MQEILLVIHLILTVGLVILVLVQHSSGGALGIGGGQGGAMSGRAATTPLSRVTTWVAVGFFVTSLGLAVIAKQQSTDSSVFDTIDPAAISEPVLPELETGEMGAPDPVMPESVIPENDDK